MQFGPPTTSSTSTLLVRTGGERSSGLHGRGDDDGLPSYSAAAGDAFARLMGATHVPVGVRTQKDGERSAAQMFEPSVADAHERRRKTLEEQARTDALGAGGEGRFDRTSVEARRAMGVDAASANQTSESADLGRPWNGGSGEVNRVPPADHSASPMDALRLLASEGQLQVDGSNSEGVVARGGQAPAAAAAATADVPDASQSIEITDSVVNNAAGPTAVGKTGGPATQNIAQQTGQLLASPRIAEVESVRATNPSQAAADAHTATTPRKSTDPTTHNQRGYSDARPQLSEKAAATARSQFEQLVHSIRLRLGLRNSSARLRLHPPQLGQIRVDVRIAGDQVRIGVQTETDEARELLAQRAVHLKAALEHHGISVDRFEVATNTTEGRGDDSDTGEGLGLPWDAGRDGDRHSPPRVPGTGPRGEHEEDYGSAGESIESIDRPQVTAVGNRRLDIRV